MKDKTKIPLVRDRVQLFQRLHGDSEFAGADKPRTGVSRDTLAVSGRMQRLLREWLSIPREEKSNDNL